MAGASADSYTAAVCITSGGERRLYTRRLRVIHAGLALGLSGVLSIGPVGEFITFSHAWALAVAGSVVAGGALLAGALVRRGVVVTPGRVTVRGLFTTRHYSTSDVEGFEPPVPYGKLFGRVGLRLMLRDGRVRTSGVFTNTPIDVADSVGRRECVELNRWLELHTSTAGDVASLPDRRPDARLTRAVDRGVIIVAAAFALACLAGAVLDPTFGVIPAP